MLCQWVPQCPSPLLPRSGVVLKTGSVAELQVVHNTVNCRASSLKLACVRNSGLMESVHSYENHRIIQLYSSIYCPLGVFNDILHRPQCNNICMNIVRTRAQRAIRSILHCRCLWSAHAPGYKYILYIYIYIRNPSNYLKVTIIYRYILLWFGIMIISWVLYFAISICEWNDQSFNWLTNTYTLQEKYCNVEKTTG